MLVLLLNLELDWCFKILKCTAPAPLVFHDYKCKGHLVPK